MVGCKGGNSANEYSLSVLSQNKGGRTPMDENFHRYSSNGPHEKSKNLLVSVASKHAI